MLAIVEEMGVEITRHTPHDVTLRAGKLTTTTPDPVRFAKIRGALVLMGSLLAREGEVNLAQPGGDQIGRRRVDTHILALQALGAQFILTVPATCLHCLKTAILCITKQAQAVVQWRCMMIMLAS
jgi:UDP-N-acetylglucosamine 1-carboxyvinyltransferase